MSFFGWWFFLTPFCFFLGVVLYLHFRSRSFVPVKASVSHCYVFSKLEGQGFSADVLYVLDVKFDYIFSDVFYGSKKPFFMLSKERRFDSMEQALSASLEVSEISNFTIFLDPFFPSIFYVNDHFDTDIRKSALILLISCLCVILVSWFFL